MFQTLEELVEELAKTFNYNNIEKYKYLENNILKLYNENFIQEIQNGDYNLWVGNYHSCTTKNYDEMKKYYLMAIEDGNSDAMHNLGFHFENNKNYDEMKKYYLMAIENGNSSAMNNLGVYYKCVERNYDEMKKYYLMAIENNNTKAMYNLGLYYENTDLNYYVMEKYYLMAIENNNTLAMIKLAKYYSSIESNYYKMKKYYLMAIENKNTDAMIYLGKYYRDIEKNYDEMKKYYLMIINNNIKLSDSEKYNLYLKSLLSGKEFKELFPNYCALKIIGSNKKNFQYKEGLNENNEVFDPTDECLPGGLYFTNFDNIFDFLCHGKKVAFIEILDDEPIWIEPNKCKTNKLFITKIITLDEYLNNMENEDKINVLTKYKSLITYLNKENQLQIIKQSGITAIDYLKCIETPDKELQLEAYKQNKNSIQFIKNPCKEILIEKIKNDVFNLLNITHPAHYLQIENLLTECINNNETKENF